MGDWEKVREGCVFSLPCVLKINLEHINYIWMCLKASRAVSKSPGGNYCNKKVILAGFALQSGAKQEMGKGAEHRASLLGTAALAAHHHRGVQLLLHRDPASPEQ